MNVIVCGLVVLKLGWISAAAVFLSFLFMSIMFPTIFALGIYGLGTQAKKASAYIVMAIIGGAIMPKLMGYLGDIYNMSVWISLAKVKQNKRHAKYHRHARIMIRFPFRK
jgi:FHS family L-fucose permease-like MFS transporter